MNTEEHLKAFEERKEAIFKWALEVRGIEKAQRSIGDNSSKAIVELLSAYLHKKKIVEDGFQLNHAWFKSKRVYERLPDFPNKQAIVEKMIKLELLCEKLSYGAQKPKEKSQEAVSLFQEMEVEIKKLLNDI